MKRFWDKIAITNDEECWLWLAGKDKDGYGLFKLEGKTVRATRFCYEITTGKKLKNYALHTCDNPSCVNPKHIYDGTAKDNMKDCKSRGRYNHSIGENTNTMKVSDSDILRIRKLKDKISGKEIANRFGLSETHVSRILSGQRRQYVGN
jgi:hypothetical protein